MIRTITTICSSTSSQGPQEGIDHLFLLPERVLGMDGAQLRQDLAALDFKVQLLQSAPSGNVWLSGGGSGHEVNGQLPNDLDTSSSQPNAKSPAYSRPKDGQTQQQLDREERLRVIREKQNEERQKKLEELKQQALAAQKYREKTEEDRRRRIEDLRCRENDRRHQVEERKRLIMEAERDRREAILRRNMEREARIESKRKMERSSIVFAFGSSTPRMLEPTESGGTYWASRRATSTTNVMSMSVAIPGPLTRRSSERELTNGNKKRATSAGGLLDRKNADGEGKENLDTGTALGQQRSAARRKTDLMPTVPSSTRETALFFSSSTVSRNSSACSSRRSPGRAFSMTRLDQLSQPRTRKVGSHHAAANDQQQQQYLQHSKVLNEANVDMSKSMTHLAAVAAGGGTGGGGSGSTSGEKTLKRAATSKSMVHLGPPRMTRAERLRKLAREGNSTCSPPPTSAKLQATSPSGSRSGETTPRPQSALSQHSGSTSVTGTTRPRPSTASIRKQRPISIAVTGVTSSLDSVKQGAGNGGKSPSIENRPPVPKVHVTKKSASKTEIGRKTEKPKSSKSSMNTTPKETPLQSPTMDLSTESSFSGSESGDRLNMSSSKTEMTTSVSNAIEKPRPSPQITVELAAAEPKSDEFPSSDGVSDLAECDMTGSMTSSQIRRITTEEEAKAALAERRRLAREQAEREAELEQRRLEAERLAEEERLQREEEEQRKMEEEQLRLLEQSKRAEEERLLQAIEEAQKREEEERLRKEEELKLKLEKEEADKKAKEEAEKLRQEMEIKLKKEEEDRQARRKRVEAIMLRTRAKGGTPSATPTKESSGDVNDENLNGVNNNKVISDSRSNKSINEHDQFLAAERNEISTPDSANTKQNGVHLTIESRNVTNNLLDLTDFDVINTNMIPSTTVSPQIIDLAVSKENYNSNQQDIPDLLS